MGKIINDICINFVLGIQYFRIIPPRDEWAEDFAHIKEIGLDTVKIEAVWSQIESIPGKYEWNEIDGLMDLADKTGLKVLLTLTFETIPDAIFNVSNAFVMDLDRRQEPVKRGFGGVWRHQCCWDNPLLLRHVEKYILTAVRRYRRHPALLCWDVFQEIDIPECTCGYTKKSYRQWLKAKYKDIRKVNKIYGERYRSFADAEPPYSRTSLEGQNYLNYTLFRAESLAKRIRWLNSLVKSLDKQHPVTAHAHSGTLNLPNEAAHDDWLAGREVDFYGTSTHEFNSAHDNIPSFARAAANLQVQSSAARDKNYYWVTELSAGPAFGAGVIHRRLNERELSYNLWFSVAGGAKGIFLWQFKPERLFFHETPSAWGLCNLDGGETYRTKELREFIKILKKNEKQFLKMRPPASEYGLLYLPDSQNIAACLKYPGVSYSDAFFGAVFMFWINNIRFDILRFPEELKNYGIIYCPMPWMLNKDMLNAVKQYVRAGGVFISDGGFARYTEDGWLSPRIPGGGLADELGARETDFAVQERTVIKTKKGLLFGAQERGWMKNERGRTLGSFGNNKPAIVKTGYGKGYFILMGTSISAYLYRTGDVKSAGRCADFFGFKPMVEISPAGNITASIQNAENSKILFIFNNSDKKSDAKITLPFPLKNPEIIAGGNLLKTISGKTLAVSLVSKGILVIKINLGNHRHPDNHGLRQAGRRKSGS